MLYLCTPKKSYRGIHCKYEVHDFVEVLDEFCVRYFVSDADQRKGSGWKNLSHPLFQVKPTVMRKLFLFVSVLVAIVSCKPAKETQKAVRLPTYQRVG